MSEDDWRSQKSDPIEAKVAKSDDWVRIQTKTFTRWCNIYLSERLLNVKDITTDFDDGINLINLLEEISGKSFGKYNKKAKFRAMKLENLAMCFQFLKRENLKLVGIGPEDVADGNLKLILGLIWTIILRFQIQRGGGSAKHDLLEWVRKQIPEYDINNFKDDWKDGKAIMALAESIENGTFDLNNDMTDDPYHNCKTTFDRVEDELKIPKVLDPEDMIEHCDEHSNMTYISMYRDYLENRKKRLEDEEAAKLTVPANTKVYGPGVEEDQEQGIETEFYITAINKFNKCVNHGGDAFEICVKNAGKEEPVEVIDNNDGTYVVKYKPTKVGTYVISVNLDGKCCGESPFRVTCNPAVVDPSQTLVYGKGVESVELGKEAPFTIKSINRKGDQIESGNTPYNVSVTGPHGPVEVAVKDNGDGTYDCSYNPVDKGEHVVEVKLDDAQVANSPYHVPANLPSDVADNTTSYAEGPGLKEGNTAEVSEYTIYTLNSNGEKVNADPELFTVDVIGPNGPCQANLSTNDDGVSINVSFQPEEVGEYTINTLLHNPFNRIHCDHIVGSPVSVNIQPGTSAGETYAYGPGIEDGVVDNEPTYFHIQAKDRKGDNMDKGGEEFDVKITDQNGNDVPFDFKDNDDGTYTVNYAVDSPGDYDVDVQFKGEHIKDAPFKVSVKAGNDAGFSIVDTYSFVIQAKDRRGDNMEVGGGNFSVDIQGPNGKVDDVTVDDLNNGRYCVTYKLEGGEGEYTVGILLNDKHIKGSPFKQIF